MVLNGSLDYESVKEYKYTVQVSDGEFVSNDFSLYIPKEGIW